MAERLRQTGRQLQPAEPRPDAGGIRGRETIAGWVFTAPMILILGVFLFIPVLMALYVSMTTWNGNGSPFAGMTQVNSRSPPDHRMLVK